MNTSSGDGELERGDAGEERTLGELLEREGALPAQRVARVAAQVLEALAAAHGRGEVHGDLTPAAVVLAAAGDSPGAARLIGFGGGEPIGVAGAGVADGIVGTPSYVAPERLRGEPATPRSDLYALGLVMAEALTGEAVARGPDAASICALHLDDEPLPLAPEVSASPLGEVIRRAIEKDPDWRFADAAEMLAVLERIPFEPDDDAWGPAAPARGAEAGPAAAAQSGGEALPQKPGGRVAPVIKLVVIVGATVLVLLATIEVGRYALHPDPAPETPPALAAPPAPEIPEQLEVQGLRGATSDQIRAAILAAGWEIVDDSAYEMPGIQARTFRVRHGEDEATVYWNQHRSRGVAQRLVRTMREAPTTATAREGGTLVYVFHPYQMTVAQELLAQILTQHQRQAEADAGADAGPRATQPADH